MIEPIRYHDGRPMLLAGIRQRYSFADCALGIPAQWQQFVAHLPLPHQLGTCTYGAICGADEQGMEYMVAVEVERFAELPSTPGRMRIEAQRYAVFLHRGHVSTLPQSWREIFETWLPNADVQSAHKPDFEVYGPAFDPITGSGDIEIWVAIAERL